MAKDTAVNWTLLETVAQKILRRLHPKRNLAVGDVVIEPNAKRGEWPLGRVLEVYSGADNLVRVVKVRGGQQEYTRPEQTLSVRRFVKIIDR